MLSITSTPGSKASEDSAVEGGAVFVDTDGVEKPVLVLLKNHGFNFVRLRTFVEPSAPYGYASGNGCQAKAEAYNDRDHTVDFAREVKAAGMGLLLDLHSLQRHLGRSRPAGDPRGLARRAERSGAGEPGAGVHRGRDASTGSSRRTPRSGAGRK
jgi:hypothetical protein